MSNKNQLPAKSQSLSITRRMANEIADGQLFTKAVGFGGQYLNRVKSRNVAPTASDVARLREFHQPLPDAPGDANQVLELLHKVGTPATMAQTGGRFFWSCQW